MDIEAEQLASRYRIARFGFLVASLACGLMAFDAAGHTIRMFVDDRALVQFFESDQWLWWASTGVAWSALLGTLALVGRWDTPFWRTRVNALLVLAAIGVLFWAIRHGHRLGLFESEAPLPWLRLQLSLGFRWAWMFLFAELASAVCDHLGRAEAARLHEAVRALLLIGVATWLLLVVGNLRFALGGPVMLPQRLWALFLLQWLLFSATRAAACFSVTILALMAARECRTFLVERRRQAEHV
jgi:hypothetical protein